MDLISPESGLIIWQAVIFLIVLLILSKFAWRPIMNGLKERESTIAEALASAEAAKKEMAQLKADNERLLAEARQERDKILKDATAAANDIKETAKAEAEKQGARMIEDAKATINAEKDAALRDVKEQVAALSLEVAEKLLRKNLDTEESQKNLVTDFVNDLKLN